MIKKNLITENFIQERYLAKNLKKKLSTKFNKIYKNLKKDINNTQNIFNILNNNYNFNFNFKDLKYFLKFKSIIIVGMGGSILGSSAIFEFLNSKLKKKVYFIDDIDTDNIKILQNKHIVKNTLFIIISKSGNTLETLSNIFSFKIFRKKGKNKNIILISERNHNTLNNLAKSLRLFHIEHKKHIGGRYSVLSEVGIVPAYLMGVNVKKLRRNLTKYLYKDKNFLQDSTIKLTNILLQKKFNSLIFLNFHPKLNSFLMWYQQLFAESLGKEGKGMLPVISNVPKDFHSLLQLYLDGPKDKLFHIFYYEGDTKKKINTKNFSNDLNYLNNKSLNQVKAAQKNALIKVLKKKKIPFRFFNIKKFEEETLGELFSYFMIETAIIGKLLKINPFNQPAVEQLKIHTKKLLIKGRKNYF